MAKQIHVSDVGTKFRPTVKDDGLILDISGASTLQMFFRKPTGAVITRTAVLDTSGTDGKMKYVSIAGDLDVAGEWRVQGRVVIGGGDWHTDEARFTVWKNLA